MAIDLLKRGQTVDITKKHQGLSKLTVGLSWGKVSTGLFGFFSSDSMDIDSSVLMVDKNGNRHNLVYYANKSAKGIRHAGDDTTGNNKFGEVDNEEIYIDLKSIPSDVTKLVFIANIYRAGSKHFGQVKGAYIRLLNSDNKTELVRYKLAEDFKGKKSIIVGELYKSKDEWKFRAVGEGSTEGDLTKVVRTYLS